jgi:hypothetical protein
MLSSIGVCNRVGRGPMPCYQTRLDRYMTVSLSNLRLELQNQLQHTVLVPVYSKAVPTYATLPEITPTTGKRDAIGDWGKQVRGSPPQNLAAAVMW